MGPWESTPSTSIHEHPGHCTGRDRSWAHGSAPYPQAFTIILCAEIVGKAHGLMGDHPIHEHPRASCALHRQGLRMCPWESTPSTSIRAPCALHMGPWESTLSTSIHEHPVGCTGRDRSCILGRASPPRAATSTLRPRAYTSILGIAQVGIVHGLMGAHPIHKPSRASCALQS